MARILVFGRAGQVAKELAALKWPDDCLISFMGRAECDLLKEGAAARAIQTLRPDFVINAAAYTAVDKAESDQDAAYALNASVPTEIAAATAAIGARLIHLSTDYVFDGFSLDAYRENDPCAPVSVYGASKLAGEIGIRECHPQHLILRTSWVFSPYGGNFVRTMLRLGVERDELAIVDDQRGGPTAAADIAATIAKVAMSMQHGASAYGTYHYAGAPVTTWFGFAGAIFDLASRYGFKTPRSLRPIATSDYPTAATRPFNSELDCSAIARVWGIEQPLWQNALNRCIEMLADEAFPDARIIGLEKT